MHNRNMSKTLTLKISVLLSGLALTLVTDANAYPEFQQFVEKHSGKSVNCALCHSNGNGPVGKESGQIGGLNEKEIQTLNSARTALEPNMLKADSPILNKFGNSIIRSIGKKKFLENRSYPEKLAEQIDKKTDTDEDGIPDAEEYLDGTDPTNNAHGDPLKLLLVNFNRYKSHLLLAGFAVFLLDWGFAHIIKAFYRKSSPQRNETNKSIGE